MELGNTCKYNLMNSYCKFLFLQVSTRLEEDPSVLPQSMLQHPLSLTPVPPTRPLLLPTKPQSTKPLPTKPLLTKPQPTRLQPARSRFRSTRRLGSQWQQLTIQPPQTLPSLPQLAPRLQAFPSHSVVARFTLETDIVEPKANVATLQVNSCWAIGQADVDCPNHGLCWYKSHLLCTIHSSH